MVESMTVKRRRVVIVDVGISIWNRRYTIKKRIIRRILNNLDTPCVSK